MKIDLHCHSKYSERPTLWIMQKLGCPESFTEPLELYRVLRRQGMSAVTITDHNVIDGCLDIADQPATFISCEYTTYFPEDRCKAHVIAYDINEKQHSEISKARENIFDLTHYLNSNAIRHVCAHPLFSPNSRLGSAHLEKLLLLFKNLELNGDQPPETNQALKRLVKSLTSEHMEQLVEKHGILPRGPEPWRKNLVGGSDDHSSLNLGSTYTEVPSAQSLEEYWQGIENDQAMVIGQEATPQRFARNVYGTAYQFYKGKFDLEYYADRDILLRFIDRMLHSRPESPASPLLRLQRAFSRNRRPKKMHNTTLPLFQLARLEAARLVQEHPQLLAVVNEEHKEGGLERKWFDFVDELSSKLFVHLGENMVDRLLNARIFDLFHSMGSAGALYALLAPYFVGYSHFTQQRQTSQKLLAGCCDAALQGLQEAKQPKMAHFTDTFHDVNGVARTLQQQLATARKLGMDYTVVTCQKDPHDTREGLQTFEPMGSYSLPEYPEIKLLAPPFLQILDYCYESGFTHIHISTPGPVGLAGLAAASILQLPVSGTYHTAIPQYGQILTDDSYVEDMLWRCMIWFYEQLESVYVPSKATGDELIAKGLNPRKIKVYPRGVDVERFHPKKKCAILGERYGLREEEVAVLYVGRVSKEKKLDVLSQAFKALAKRNPEVRLLVVGEGPYREALEQNTRNDPVIFTGTLEGEDLSRLYASADLLVFPSTTDTFGNVVLEAQASGIPVIVTDQGGPQENLIPGETGLIVPGDDVEELFEAMSTLTQDHARRKRMGSAARQYMAQRSFANAFTQLWGMYTTNQAKPLSPLDLAASVTPIIANEAPAS